MEDLTMKRLTFGTLASLMCIVFLGAMPEMSFAKDGKWRKRADMPSERWSLAAGVVNQKIYVIGGLADRKVLATIEEYNPLTNRWAKKANMLTAKAVHSTSVVNGKIYVIGGVASR